MKVGDRHYRSIWADERPGTVTIIDQSRLPHVFETRTIGDATGMAEAIRTMRVRGAPLIGVAAAFGVALAMLTDQRDKALRKAVDELRGNPADGGESRLGARADGAPPSRDAALAAPGHGVGRGARASPTRTWR
jgi:methylthioribose-1-phosphate isomerase